jgi:hypothetical protein
LESKNGQEKQAERYEASMNSGESSRKFMNFLKSFSKLLKEANNQAVVLSQNFQELHHLLARNIQTQPKLIKLPRTHPKKSVYRNFPSELSPILFFNVFSIEIIQ